MATTPVTDAKRFIVECLTAAGASPKNSEIVAHSLVEADYRGHYNHGMNRLESYVRDIQRGYCDPNATPTIETETAAIALVNGNNGFGAVVGKYCMDLAIQKAGNVGVALVTARFSNHYGKPALYSLQAINKGMIGITCTNKLPLMVPPGAKEAVLGTNPIAVGAPGLDNDYFLLDMTVTAADMEKIEVAKEKGTPMPKGWALNDAGLPETDPLMAYENPKLVPLGGFKGYGLGMLVEILSGILSGSKYGPHIKKQEASSEACNLGHCFIAINPKMFADGFEDRLSDLMNFIRRMRPMDPDKPVLVAGDPERMHMQKVNKQEGLRYSQDQISINTKLASEFKIKPMVADCLCYKIRTVK